MLFFTLPGEGKGVDRSLCCRCPVEALRPCCRHGCTAENVGFRRQIWPGPRQCPGVSESCCSFLTIFGYSNCWNIVEIYLVYLGSRYWLMASASARADAEVNPPMIFITLTCRRGRTWPAMVHRVPGPAEEPAWARGGPALVLGYQRSVVWCSVV